MRAWHATIATKTVAATPQKRGVASRLQHANIIADFFLTYNVTVLIRKLTKATHRFAAA